MNGIKKYACHRVYDNGYNHYLQQSVVTIAPDGEVLECKPLTEEISSTEWIGGVIVLSHRSEIPSYSDFKTMLNEITLPGQAPLYAWHIAGFDFTQEELTPQSIIRRL